MWDWDGLVVRWHIYFRPNIPFHLVRPISAPSLSFEQKLIYHRSNIVLIYRRTSFQHSSCCCYHPAKILPNIIVVSVQKRMPSIHSSLSSKAGAALGPNSNNQKKSNKYIPPGPQQPSSVNLPNMTPA